MDIGDSFYKENRMRFLFGVLIGNIVRIPYEYPPNLLGNLSNVCRISWNFDGT